MRLVAFRSSIPQATPETEARQLCGILPWVDSLHLKGPENEPRGSLIRLIEHLPAKDRKKLWLHGHFELAVEYGLGGIHLSRKALSGNGGLGVYAGIHGLDASISCHDLADARKFADLYERVFICPVFDSFSKPGHRAAFGLEELKKVLGERRDAEIFALGGVTTDRIGQLKRLGFDGAAVLGALWSAGDPVEYIKAMRDRCREVLNTY